MLKLNKKELEFLLADPRLAGDAGGKVATDLKTQLEHAKKRLDKQLQDARWLLVSNGFTVHEP